MNESLREKQKAEAIFRLELMGIREDIQRKFKESGTVMFSNGGEYFPVSDKMSEEIRNFEQEHDATVFLAVRMYHALGILDALLFVGKYDEEWELERADVTSGYAMSFCVNRDYPECSEMGSIYFSITEDGVIVREG